MVGVRPVAGRSWLDWHILWWRSRHPAVPAITSVAVLPLANLSSDPEQEYFSDGMTDAIINELSRASTLKVISRTSVMRYKGTKKPVEEIARELHVDAVIEGSVFREGNHVRDQRATHLCADRDAGVGG